MKISVVCPVYNESAWIDQLLRFIVSSEITPKEVFLVDGGSADDTVEKISAWQAQYPFIKLLHNPRKYVPFALNLAIPQCTGDIIVRLDAHTEYASDYFEKIVQVAERTRADIVGGPTLTRWKNPLQQAVANAICSPFGIGDSKVHFKDYEGWTDSVTFGSWRREIFEKTGLFDTGLMRNQDDEFHYRCKAMGFKIYQSPEIKLYYYPRDKYSKLFSQYYQYGLYKPLVLKKGPTEGKRRHLIPSLFVLYLISLPFALFFPPWLIPLILYLLLDLYFSFKAPAPWSVRFRMLLVYPVLHIAYGTGFLVGLTKLWNKK